FSSRRRHTRWPRDWSSDVCSSDLYYRGCVAYNQGKIATAEACFRRAVERKPDYALALYQLGLCRERQDDPAGASAAFQAAIASQIGRASCRERVRIAGGAGAAKGE